MNKLYLKIRELIMKWFKIDEHICIEFKLLNDKLSNCLLADMADVLFNNEKNITSLVICDEYSQIFQQGLINHYVKFQYQVKLTSIYVLAMSEGDIVQKVICIAAPEVEDTLLELLKDKDHTIILSNK